MLEELWEEYAERSGANKCSGAQRAEMKKAFVGGMNQLIVAMHHRRVDVVQLNAEILMFASKLKAEKN